MKSTTVGINPLILWRVFRKILGIQEDALKVTSTLVILSLRNRDLNHTINLMIWWGKCCQTARAFMFIMGFVVVYLLVFCLFFFFHVSKHKLPVILWEAGASPQTLLWKLSFAGLQFVIPVQSQHVVRGLPAYFCSALWSPSLWACFFLKCFAMFLILHLLFLSIHCLQIT